MAWMCVVIAVVTILSTAFSFILVLALQAQVPLEELELPVVGRVMLRFVLMSGPVMAALGIGLAMAGALALAKRHWMLPSLKLGAWAGIGFMGILAILWAQCCIAEGASLGLNVSGCVIHAVQALLISFALRYLRRPELEAAVLSGAPAVRASRRPS